MTEKPKAPLQTPANVVQFPQMDTADIRAQVAQIDSFYAARRAACAAASPIQAPPAPALESHACARCGWTWQTFAGVVPKTCPACRARKWQTACPPRISDTVRKCLHCGHEWRARKADRPTACPVCHARNWDRLPKFRRNTESGHNAAEQNAENTPNAPL